MFLQLFLQGILDLLWPPRTTCLLCEGTLPQGGVAPDGLSICDLCWESMPFATGETCCTNCKRPLFRGRGICAECASATPFGRVWALGLHRGALREAIHHLKFSGRMELGPALGRRLAASTCRGYDLILPMPLHPTRLRERGYNQAALIAAGLASALERPLVDGELLRLRRTGHQAKLHREDRLQNLKGAFGARRQAFTPWTGRRVLLVDDVLTTGATAAAATEVLRQTGARCVDLAVLAVSDKPVDVCGLNQGSSRPQH